MNPGGSPEADQHVARYVEDLTARAEVQVEPQKSIKLYIRSAELVFRQACIYRGEGDAEKAYVLFLKYSKYGGHLAGISDAWAVWCCGRSRGTPSTGPAWTWWGPSEQYGLAW